MRVGLLARVIRAFRRDEARLQFLSKDRRHGAVAAGRVNQVNRQAAESRTITGRAIPNVYTEDEDEAAYTTVSAMPETALMEEEEDSPDPPAGGYMHGPDVEAPLPSSPEQVTLLRRLQR